MTEKEPREHGNILGRGDKFGGEVDERPVAYTPGARQIPGYNSGPVLR